MHRELKVVELYLIYDSVNPNRPDSKPSEALIADIRANGIREPVTLVAVDEFRFSIVSGWNRIAASRINGSAAINAIVWYGATDQIDYLRMEW